jgi:small subunit ribosomal protein S10
METKIIRIELKSYDHNLVDKSSYLIINSVKKTGAIINGPICLPIHRQIFTVLRSPHVNKKSRDQYELLHHKIIIFIYSFSEQTVDALMYLDLPSGIEILIKM